jgi:hypothetical protein
MPRLVTSQRQKPIEVDLNRSPMVMEEFAVIEEIPPGAHASDAKSLLKNEQNSCCEGGLEDAVNPAARHSAR